MANIRTNKPKTNNPDTTLDTLETNTLCQQCTSASNRPKEFSLFSLSVSSSSPMFFRGNDDDSNIAAAAAALMFNFDFGCVYSSDFHIMSFSFCCTKKVIMLHA